MGCRLEAISGDGCRGAPGWQKDNVNLRVAAARVSADRLILFSQNRSPAFDIIGNPVAVMGQDEPMASGSFRSAMKGEILWVFAQGC